MRWRSAAIVAGVAVLTVAGSPARADDTALIGAVTTTTLHTPDADGDLQHHSSGGGASLLVMFYDDDITGGFEFGTMFLSGDDDRRLYDLGISILISPGIEDTSPVPFLKVGLDLAAASQPVMDGGRERDVMLGVHGAIGLHGHLGNRVVWRAQAGYHGAGVGGIAGQLGIGYIFGD